MEKLAVLILAAGKGKRMGGELPKVLVATREQPLLGHVLESVSSLKHEKLILITGFGKEQVREYAVSKAASLKLTPEYVVQSNQLGTGDAVRAALANLKEFVGTVLILCGDVPLVRSETLQNFLVNHESEKATVSVLSFSTTEPNSYGRIIRSPQDGQIQKIVERQDASANEMIAQEFNSGIYAIDSAFLGPAIEELNNENSQGEYYLTDIVGQAVSEGQRVVAYMSDNAIEFQGVNDLVDLAKINIFLRQSQINCLIRDGVQIESPESVLLDPQVKVAPGVRIGPQVQLRGTTTVASGVVFEGSALVIDSQIDSNALIRLGVRIEGSVIGKDCAVGPFAHLRPGTTLESHVKVGNFVETKNSTLRSEVKAGHLTYLGDADVGVGANIGAGTITCNYDGQHKHRTKIGAAAFIGSNSALVAPVEIGDNAYVGAGSVITKDVEAEALAFTRAKQTVKPGWSNKKTAK